MALVLKCEHCNSQYRYEASEIKNIGTFGQPVLQINCRSCGKPIIHKDNKLTIVDDATYIKKEENGYSLTFKQADSSNDFERANQSDIREYWIQKYVKQNYEKLGINKIEGPYNTGPDFKGIYKNGKSLVDIEVERDCETYLKHKHHKSDKFKNVKILIVLNPDKPSSEIKKYLPKKIIYIDIEDFINWWRPEVKKYVKENNLKNIIRMIGDEFQNKFIDTCSYKENELITCPNCDLCAYFGNGTFNEASSMFWEMAIKFIVIYKYPIGRENFVISSIKNEDIGHFFREYFIKL